VVVERGGWVEGMYKYTGAVLAASACGYMAAVQCTACTGGLLPAQCWVRGTYHVYVVRILSALCRFSGPSLHVCHALGQPRGCPWAICTYIVQWTVRILQQGCPCASTHCMLKQGLSGLLASSTLFGWSRQFRSTHNSTMRLAVSVITFMNGTSTCALQPAPAQRLRQLHGLLASTHHSGTSNNPDSRVWAILGQCWRTSQSAQDTPDGGCGGLQDPHSGCYMYKRTAVMLPYGHVLCLRSELCSDSRWRGAASGARGTLLVVSALHKKPKNYSHSSIDVY
jgi:hypothetical protein